MNRRDWSEPEFSSPPPGPLSRIRLMAEYVCGKIRVWADEWEFGGGEGSSDEEFGRRGELLAAEIAKELGSGVIVEYVP